MYMILAPARKWIISALIALPLPAMASVTTVSFGTISNSSYQNINNNVEAAAGTNYDNTATPGYIFNQFDVIVGGETITVSGWSDTRDGDLHGSPDGAEDNTIERVVDFDRNGNGWSIENRDEGQGSGSPQHSADNIDSGDGIDYDFYLLDFGSQQVQLQGVFSSWNYVEDQLNQQSGETQLSAVALNNLTNTDLTGQTFSSLRSSSYGYGSSTFSASTGNQANIASYYADVSVNASSSLWIVSAYNIFFGEVNGATANNDGFKLAGVVFTTNTTTDIPEPSSLAVLTLALIGLVSYRKKNN